jgi:hypothetical protein
MLPHNPQPTPYQDVNVFVDLLQANMRAILGDQFVGLYLGGSLALGDFNPQRSDIDFVAITAEQLPPVMVVALELMHARLWAAEIKWGRKLDGSYVPQQVFRHWIPDHAPCPFVEADAFCVTNQGSAVIQRHILREHGVVVVGPKPQTMLDPVVAGELRLPLRDMLEQWWRPLLHDPTWLQQSHKQPFAILTMCRMLYTLEHGVIVSKPVATRWCQRGIAAQWAELLDWALTWPHITEPDYLAATLNFIAYTLDRCRQQGL